MLFMFIICKELKYGVINIMIMNYIIVERLD